MPLVCYCFDLYYLRPFMASAKSLIANWAAQEQLSILCVWQANDKNDFMRRTVMTLSPFVDIKIHIYSSEVIPLDAPSYYITNATQLRLFLHEIVQVDKVLYLDCDTIVVGDISPIFEYEPEYIGACNLFGFNAGVLLLNLKNLRNSNFSSFRDEQLKFKLNDQSIIQQFMKGTHLILPARFNSFGASLDPDAVLLHYCNGKKPWKVPEALASQVWCKWDSIRLNSDQVLNTK